MKRKATLLISCLLLANIAPIHAKYRTAKTLGAISIVSAAIGITATVSAAIKTINKIREYPKIECTQLTWIEQHLVKLAIPGPFDDEKIISLNLLKNRSATNHLLLAPLSAIGAIGALVVECAVSE